MKLTFVNALDTPSLAIIVPVIARAMVEGNGSTKQKGAAACGTFKIYNVTRHTTMQEACKTPPSPEITIFNLFRFRVCCRCSYH